MKVVYGLPDEVGGHAQLYLLEKGSLRPVPGLENVEAHSPIVLDRERLVYLGLERYATGGSYEEFVEQHEERFAFSLRSWNLRERKGSELLRLRGPVGTSLSALAAGPDGRFLAGVQNVEDDARVDRLLMFNAEGEHLQYEYPKVPLGTEGVEWGPWDWSRQGLVAARVRAMQEVAHLMADVDGPGPAAPGELEGHGEEFDRMLVVVLGPDVETLAWMVRGWSLIGFSPDGRWLALSRGRTVGVVRVPELDLNEMRIITREAPGHVWFGEWGD